MRLLPSGAGITPAGAGKTMAIRYMCRNIEDHPRRCGENDAAESVTVMTAGSPPQVRGKHLTYVCNDKTDRITPADAGKTYQRADRRDRKPDHPRGCGENEPVFPSGDPAPGSPPRMRGKPLETGLFSVLSGITPAYAGKTLQNLEQAA